MKLFVLFVVCLCVIYIGILYSNYHKKKLIIFSDLVKFCDLFESSIRFSKSTILQVVRDHKDLFSQEFNKILEDYFVKRKSIECDYLNEKEQKIISDFFSSLGKQDLLGEVGNVKNYKTKFEATKISVEQNNSKFGVLGLKLGILGALLIFVIFI